MLAALAGLLAERGITELTLVHADGRGEKLRARRTDLPGVLLKENRAELRCDAPALQIAIAPGVLAWETSNAELAAQLEGLRSA